LRSNAAGFAPVQRAYTRRAFTTSTIFLAMSGKTPSSTKAPISPGDRIPAGEEIAAS
jgi:hypothetical protein